MTPKIFAVSVILFVNAFFMGAVEVAEVIKVLSQSDLAAKRKIVQEIYEAGENKNFLSFQSEDENRLIRFCIKLVQDFDWNQIMNLPTEDFHKRPQELQEKALTATFALNIICLGSVQENPFAVDFLKEQRLLQEESPNAKMITGAGEKFLHYYQEKKYSLEVKNQLLCSAEEGGKKLIDILKTQSYRDQEISRRFFQRVIQRKDVMEELRKSPEQCQWIIAQGKVQYLELLNDSSQDRSLRVAFVHLVTDLMEPAEAILWLKDISSDQRLSERDLRMIQNLIMTLENE